MEHLELGSGRGDMYRVAWDAWREQPLRGIGAEDFQPVYLEHRRTSNAPRYAHSLPIGLVLGLGIVGGLLAAALVATLLVATVRAYRRAAAATRTAIAVAVAASVGWALQAAWDWTWEFPALTLTAIVLLGASARATDEAGAAPTAEQRHVRERAAQHGIAVDPWEPDVPVLPRSAGGRAAAAAIGLVAAGLIVALGAIAAGNEAFRQGTRLAASDLAASADRLALAARLNPLDGDATLSRAIVLRRQGDVEGWRRELERTAQRAPNDWLGQLELAIIAANAAPRRGARRDAAVAQVRRAVARNPQQPALREVLRDAEAGRPIDPGVVEARIAERRRLLEHPFAGS